MFREKRTSLAKALGVFILCLCVLSIKAQNNASIKVIAFYTAKRDTAHITYVHEANKFFPKMAAKYNFSYDSTDNWANLNAEFLARYQVVLFLDTRPEAPEQREAFQ